MDNTVDNTEQIRRAMIANGEPAADRAVAEATGAKTWTTDTLSDEFDVTGFLAPFVVVREKATGRVGSLEFAHSPRVYFNFVPD